MAYNCAYDIAKDAYKQRKLLYIYGEVGIGKTHLVQAIGNYITERYSTAKVGYISIDVFTNEMINAIMHDNLSSFKETFLSYDVLIIDNLQFIIGKDRTQEEFFRIVSELLEKGRQVVIVSIKPPQDIAILNERFTSMFELGGAFEIKRPDLDTRMEILRRRLAEENMTLSDEEIRIIADNVSDNIRELLNAFNRIVTYAKMTGEEINSNFIVRVLE